MAIPYAHMQIGTLNITDPLAIEIKWTKHVYAIMICVLNQIRNQI